METKETTIDKSYDQTAFHVHEQGRTCPKCFHHTRVEPPFDGHVSPAILEQRIIDLSAHLNAMSKRAVDAERRIIQFEQLTDVLAQTIDGMRELLSQYGEDQQ